MLSHGARAVQSAVCLGEYVAIRTCHDGFRAIMVFDLKRDPHETRDLAPDHPELAAAAMAKLEAWYARQMAKSADGIDPIWTVLRETAA